MRIFGKRFMAEEIMLCAVLLAFFAWIFIGAFRYAPAARLFPLILSTPALFLLLLYILRGALPAGFQDAIAGDDTFAVGKSASTSSKLDIEADEATTGFDPHPYVVFGFTAIFALLAHAVGFYLAAPISIAAYLTTVRRPIRQHAVLGTILLLLALALIALFDSAFGHHYGRGALLSVF